MKNLKNFFGLKRLLLTACLLLSLTASAQLVSPIDGELTPNPGTLYEYTTVPDLIFFTTPYATLTPSNAGEVSAVELMPDGYTLRFHVTWFLQGAATMKVFYNSTLVAQQNVTVTCASLPSTPTLSIYTPVCGTSGTAVLDATPGAGGDNVKWYTASTGGTLLSSTTTLITPTISTATTYYASSTNSNGYCASTSRTAITVAINAALNAPTASVEGARCTPGSVTISATPASPATSIRWYSSATAGQLIATGTSYSPNLAGEGDYYYYAASYNSTTGCSSADRLGVKASVRPVPAALRASEATVYGSGAVELIASEVFESSKQYDKTLPDTTDFQVRWFADEAKANANTPVLAKGVAYTTPIISTTGVWLPYYMRLHDKVTGCLGPVSTALARVLPLVSTQSVKTEVVRVSGKTAEADLYTLTSAQKSVSVIYMDGLGRALQQVAVKASSDDKDIIQPVEYDALGRVTKQYLPYVSDTSATGRFHSGYAAEQYNFYQIPTSKIATDTHPYARSVYEASPLGRLTEQTRAGQSFQPGSGHTGSITYGFNTGSTSSQAEEVRKFNSDGTSSGFYGANILSRTEGVNPDGVHTITFTDAAGRTIATKQQLDETIGGSSVSYLETYYIYDDFGQLKYMIQPEGVAALKSSGWVFNIAFRKQHVFQYVYDKWGRVIETRVPGKGWSYTVYDQLSRPVLTQDTLLKASNKWLFVKYDRSGRPVMTGLYTDNTNTTRSYFQTLLDNKNYQTEKHFETLNASGTHKYTNVAFPTANIEVLSVTYYDSYDFDSYGTYTTQSLADEETQGSALGRVTGSKTLIIGTSTWLKKFVYYDAKGRIIQVRSNNHLNTTPDNLSTTSYDFEKVLQAKNYHNSGTPGATTVLNTYEYYDQGRLKQVKQKNNSGTDQLVVRYEYNALGQVVDKKLHGTGSPGSEIFLQSVDYRYTINGQLASINNATLDASTSANDETTDYFGMELLYNATESNLSTTQRYSGMVSAIKWKGPGPTGSNGQRSYAFGYDKSGKLEHAAYAVKDGSAWNKEAGAQDEAMTYDRNGNIKTLTRQQRKHQLTGITGSYTSETIDNLSYTYSGANVNSLQKVTDGATTSAASGFDNGASTTGNDYGYDSNGNLLSDANKGITSIVYNFLGKPTQVNFSDGKKIEYVYDAGGNKLTQKLYQGTTLLTTTDYVNGFVYENGTLSFFGSPEGRVVNTSGTLTYEYSIADHQGNTRVVFSSEAPATNTTTVNFESATNSSVLNYTRTNFELFDHTDVSGSTYTYSQKLTGASGSQVGVAKTVKVYPGDKVKIEAYAKYYNPTATSSNITGFAAALTGAFGVSSGSTGEALKAYNTLNSYGSVIALGGGSGNGSYPKLFVNILLFDKDYNLLDAAWEQIDGGEQVGATPKAAHDLMSKEVTVKEAGFAYVFVSNENPTLVEFYVDDVVITHTPTNVIQYNEYYPFGLQTSTSWTRENTKDNNYLYNAANELNKTSGWYEMFYRGYDPAIGRMLQVDPYAPMYASHTTYNYAVNNPVMVNDPNGAQAIEYQPGMSKMGVNRYNSIASMGESGSYYGDWDWDCECQKRNNLGGGSYMEVEYTSYITHPATGEKYGYKTWYVWEWVQGKDEIEVDYYDVWSAGNYNGVNARFIFRNKDKKYKDVRWVQTVRTNYPQDGAKSPYNDPGGVAKDDDLPFYWTDAENGYYINYDGTDAIFEDNPGRDNSRNSYWIAELSVVSKQSDGTYAPITTISYGFIINSDGGVSKFPLTQNVTPSQFHLSTFANKKP